ncbi:MAG TPA: hypothetical protein DCE41_26435 [Cytophagales bacterium]|nr:hypothetical protein [Cytophagales bacterium]
MQAVNDAPVFSITPNQLDWTSEDLSSKTVTITLNHPANESNQKVTYSLQGDTALTEFILNAERGIIKVTPLSVQAFETELVLTAHDGEAENGIHTERITLSLVTTNATPTGITLSPQEVEEEQAPGTFVGIFSTLDDDVNDEHSYKISGTTFEVRADSLFTLETLDFETKSLYSLSVTSDDRHGASITDTLLITVINVDETVLSLSKEVWEAQIKVYPQPAQKYLFLETPADSYQVVIHNLQGARIAEITFRGTHCQVPILDLDPGVYLISVQSQEHHLTRRFIKE